MAPLHNEGVSVAEWSACSRRRRAWVQIAAVTLSGNNALKAIISGSRSGTKSTSLETDVFALVAVHATNGLAWCGVL